MYIQTAEVNFKVAGEIKMVYKYGIYQSSGASCIFYKENEDGNQSTFNLFVAPEMDVEGKNTIFALIDNEQIGEDSWFGVKDLTIQDIFRAFDGWASGAPIVFELDAQRNIGTFLKLALENTGKPTS